MDRQLSGALAIAKAGGMDHPDTMNRSDEYNRCVLPELQTTAEVKMKEREKRGREEEREERPSKRGGGEGVPNSLQRGVEGGNNPGNTPLPRPPKPAPKATPNTEQEGTGETPHKDPLVKTGPNIQRKKCEKTEEKKERKQERKKKQHKQTQI